MPVKNIMVTIAGGTPSMATAKYGIYMAKLLGAQLTVMCVVDEKILADLTQRGVLLQVEALEYDRELQEQMTLVTERVRKLASAKGVTIQPVFTKGVVHEQVAKKIKELNINLLVMGELKEVASRKDIFYDEGERIFREAGCPVLVVKNPQEVEILYKEI